MAKFYFFTDTDLLDVQSSGAYGPIVGSATPDEFRVMSIHTASSVPNAYAVCNGIVCIQPVNGSSTLVNIILKPTVRPNIDFVPIEYIIYKGIKLSSVINSSYVALTGNDLVDMINKSQNALNDSIDKANGNPVGTTTDRPSNEALGYHLNSGVFPDTDPIDSLFFRSDLNFQLPVVRGGLSLGTFDETEFGIEIIVDSIGYTPKLEIARIIDHTVVVTALSNSPTQPETFRHWNKKEEILNFIDPVAFYGSFYNDLIKAKNSGGASFDNKKKNEIYDDCLINFLNKDVTYIDIRNEHNFSFNYYGNYTNNIELAFDDVNTLSIVDYYGGGWPILMLNTASFPTGNTDKKNIVRISLPIGDNKEPMVFVAQGSLNEGGSGGKFPKGPKRKKRFLELASNNGTSLQEITVAIPNNEGVGVTAPVATLIKLKYVKKIQDPSIVPGSSGTVVRSKYHLDNVFQALNMNVPFAGTAKIRSKVFQDDIYVDMFQFNGQRHFAKVGIAEDSSSITFFSFASVKNNQDGKLSLTSELSNDADHFLSYADLRFDKSRIKGRETTISGGSPIQLLTNEKNRGQFFKKLFGTPLDDFFTIIIGLTNYSAMQALASSSFDPEFKVFLGVENKSADGDLDDDGFPYTKFDLILRGFVDTGTAIEVQEINSNLKIYTHDVI